MLILSRKVGETIHIGDSIVIQIVRAGDKVKVGIEAPREQTVLRGELIMKEQQRQEETSVNA